MFQQLNTAQMIAIAILPTLFAIVVHEVAHGWMAKILGDDTAERQGRLTLNPLKHIDPIGTILVPAILLISVHYAFGWARPVPVDFSRLRRPRRDIPLVAIAGPGSNLLMALAWAILARIAEALPPGMELVSQPLWYMGAFGILINAVLCVLNMLPIPPTDGARIIISQLPARLSAEMEKLMPFGMMILLVLIVSGVLWTIMRPLVYGIAITVQTVTGLSHLPY